jgi:RND family efflux transporter MFP subunit
MTRRLIHSWAAVGLVVAAVAMAACSQPHAEAATPNSPTTVAVAKVVRGDVAQTIVVTAEFRPFQEIDVHAKVSGYLKSIRVDVGDHVRAGELLAVLEVPELQNQLQEDEASVRRADEEINRAKADLDRTQSAHEVAHLAASRLSSVLKARPNLVAQQDIDEATGRDRIAEAQVSTAQATLAAAREQLDVAKATEDKTKTLFAYAQITAPFDGVITHRYADTGAMIQAGTSSQTQAMPLVRLSENSRLRLVIPVPESVVPSIHIGSPIGLTVQGLHRTFAGTVSRFSDRLDTDTRTMHVEVDVPNPNLQLVPGMFADASIVLGQAKNVLVVPVEAIDRTDTSARVMLVNRDNRVEPRDVKVGLETGNRVEVVSGLSAGDLVVVGNRSQLKAGTAVTPSIVAAVADADGGR